MGITATPVLTGLAPGTLPSGFANVAGTYGSNNAGTGIVSSSNVSGDALIFSGFTAQTNFSVHLEQIVTQVDPVTGKASLILPIFQAAANGTSGYVLGQQTSATSNFQFYSGNYATRSYTSLGSATSIGFVPFVGQTVCVDILRVGSNIYAWVYDKIGGRPSDPQVSLTDTSISAAGYVGLFLSQYGNNAISPILNKLIVGQGFTYGSLTWASGTAQSQVITVPSPSAGGVAPFTYTFVGSTEPGAPTSLQSPIAGTSGTFASAGAAAQNVSVPVTSGILYVRVLYTDSGANPESILSDEIPLQSLPTLSYMFIGDSITNGLHSTGGNDPVTLITPLLSALSSPAKITNVTNQGQPGAATQDWLPGATSGYLAAAITQAVSQSTTDVHIMLGSNDARYANTPDQYTANMNTIIAALYAGIPTLKRVYVAKPPYMGENINGALYQDNSNNLLRLYGVRNDRLADGIKVFSGSDAYSPFCQFYTVNRSGNYYTDNLHLSNSGYANLAYIWSLGIGFALKTTGTKYPPVGPIGSVISGAIRASIPWSIPVTGIPGTNNTPQDGTTGFSVSSGAAAKEVCNLLDQMVSDGRASIS